MQLHYHLWQNYQYFVKYKTINIKTTRRFVKHIPFVPFFKKRAVFAVFRYVFGQRGR